MKFILATKKPAVQIKTTSTGVLSKGAILVLAFLKSKAKQGEVEITYSEIAKGLNISRLTVFNSIWTLLTVRLIIATNNKRFAYIVKL